MRLYHPDLQTELFLSEDAPTVVAVEAPALFYRLIAHLYAQSLAKEEGGDFSLRYQHNELNITKEIDLVLNPLLLDFNQKKIINRILNDLDKLAAESKNLNATAKLQTTLQEYFADLTLDYPVPLTWTDDILISNIAKVLELTIDVGDLPLVQKIVVYMQLLTELKLARIFSFVNLRSFLSAEQLGELYHEARLGKYRLLLWESTAMPRIEPEEQRLTLDNELCIIENDFEEL